MTCTVDNLRWSSNYWASCSARAYALAKVRNKESARNWLILSQIRGHTPAAIKLPNSFFVTRSVNASTTLHTPMKKHSHPPSRFIFFFSIHSFLNTLPSNSSLFLPSIFVDHVFSPFFWYFSTFT